MDSQPTNQATAQDPRPRPVTPPEWTPPPAAPPAPPPGTPEPPRFPPAPPHPSTLPMIFEPVPAADDVDAQLLRRRIVMLTGPLTPEAAEQAAAKLLLLDERGHDPITVHVSCPDADLDAALTLVATLDLLASPTTAVAAGTVEGAAVAVYAAASTRRAHPHTTFVLREPRVPATRDGDAEDVRTAAEQRRSQVETLRARIAAATGRSQETVAHDMAHGRLLSAEQARDYGLVEQLTGQP